jgi:hypothetical protein
MLTYAMDFAEPIGVCHAAALMTFNDGLIARNERFFDASAFNKDQRNSSRESCQRCPVGHVKNSGSCADNL